MGECIGIRGKGPAESSGDVLTAILRRGAQSLLQQAIEAEIDQYMAQVNGSSGDRLVVRNGYLPARAIQTGIGDIEVKRPRCRTKRSDASSERFTSKILPPYMRRSRSVEDVLPWLYLKGISTGDFQEALASLLGEGAKGLSATTITRLKSQWSEDLKSWQSRDLAGKRYVYVWADGIHFNIRLGEDDRMCILVLMGTTMDGEKELIAISEGFRESEASWKMMLLDLKSRGLSVDPSLAIADGALGFWAALPQVFPTTKKQRCWVHKTANILDKLPKSKQPLAKTLIHSIYNAPRKTEAERLFDVFLETFDAKYPKATACLRKDKESMLAFYDFPAEHWGHIRTTNAIESSFASVRLRTYKTKGCGSSTATVMMVFKLVESAQKRWHRLRGYERLAEVIDIRWKFVDGERVEAKAA
ncbi:MAG: IS256 family transposase [Proteobacteria bacterium]|nr:IS256 family transposase [Pseudomonadota bacterium]